jgi:membrane-associated phospholipid phosphatase
LKEPGKEHVMLKKIFPLMINVLQVVFFARLAQLVRLHAVDSTDIRITKAVQKNQSNTLIRAIKIFTYLTGSPPILRIMAVLIAFFFWRKQLRLEAVMTAGIGLLSNLCKDVLQKVVDRPRPSPALVHVYQKSHGKSFPSGHVISSITFWGWLAALLPMLFKGKRIWKRILWAVAALFIGTVGPTRIYLGDHWASDVLGGYLFGSSWLGLTLRLYVILKNKGVLAAASSLTSI